MDSNSSSLPFTARDDFPLTEDDGSLSIAAGLAKEAALLFQEGKFSDCLKKLNQLSQKKPDDPKVRHNTAITETFQDGCKYPKRLIVAFQNIKKQSEELGQAPVDHLEGSSQNGSHPTTGVRGTDSAVHQFSSSSIVYGNEFDTSVAMFNIAVVWFHLHQYAKSFSYLDTLYENIVPIDEGTALRICILLMDVALLSHHASRSADVINYIERVFSGVNNLTGQVDSGTSIQQQSLLVSKSTSLTSNSTNHDASHSDSVITANNLENSLTRTLSEDEALEDESLQLLSSLEISRQKPQSLQKPSPFADDSLSAIDLRLKLHFFKVRFFLLTRNVKAARGEIKLAMNLARGKDNTMALYLKSQLEYARGNHQKAIKLLNASNNHNEMGINGISSMYHNNLGCIYYRLGKPNLSGASFTKALQISLDLRKEKNPKLLTFSQDKSLLITYNCGVSSLLCGKPFIAARCFQKASLIFYNKPLLWIRIAECCLMALEKGSDRSIRVNVIGNGKWRWCGILPNGQFKNIGNDNLIPSNGKEPDLSMDLARKCLLNALDLLESSEESDSLPSSNQSESRETPTNHKNITDAQVNSNGDIKEQKGRNNQNASLQNSITDYKNISMKENNMMKQAALADLAYVELALENPLISLSRVRSLLKLPECSNMYVFLGTMYVAEALCLLNRPSEAAEHLMRYVSDGNNVLLPYSQEDYENWTDDEKMVDNESKGANVDPSSDEIQRSAFPRPEEARGIFHANFAVQFALMGALEKSQYYMMKALSDIPNSREAILTAIYLDLKSGKTQEALAKLRQHSSVRFLPGSSSLKGSS